MDIKPNLPDPLAPSPDYTAGHSEPKANTDLAATQQINPIEKTADLMPQEQESVIAERTQALKDLVKNQGMSFEVDEETGKSVVMIVDKASGETIRQIPTKALLDISKNLADFLPGALQTKA